MPVRRQNTETFIRALENAFRHFSGVPRCLNLDHLKAAVLGADWADPEPNPKLEDFCRHCNIVLLPCKPRIPDPRIRVGLNAPEFARGGLESRGDSAA